MIHDHETPASLIGEIQDRNCTREQKQHKTVLDAKTLLHTKYGHETTLCSLGVY